MSRTTFIPVCLTHVRTVQRHAPAWVSLSSWGTLGRCLSVGGAELTYYCSMNFPNAAFPLALMCFLCPAVDEERG